MGFRFFRRIKLFPGVSLNISKSGPSLSFGPRGLKYTVGPKGTRTTVGLPGTGLYHTTSSSYPGGGDSSSDPSSPNPATEIPGKLPPILFKSVFPLLKWWVVVGGFLAFNFLGSFFPPPSALGALFTAIGAIIFGYGLFAVPLYYIHARKLRAIEAAQMNEYKEREQEKITAEREKKEKRNALISEAERYLDAVKRDRRIPATASSLMLKSGEEAYLESTALLCEERKDGFTEPDKGKLLLTNERLIFAGETENRNFTLDDILSVNPGYENIKIMAGSRSKSQFFMNIDNPYLWQALITIVRRNLTPEELSKMSIKVER